MSVQNFLKLSKKMVDRGERKLSCYVDAEGWIAMMAADEVRMQRLGMAWMEIFLPPPPPEEPPKPVVQIADSESQARCRELFGADFFGIQEAAGPYGYVFSEVELEERKPVRILARDRSILTEKKSWDLIRRCREEAPGEFVCCAGVPHSVCDALAAHPEVFHPDIRRDAWFNYWSEHNQWSDNKVPDFWFLLRKEVVPNSWDKSSAERDSWLPHARPHERFAEPQHIVYGDVLCEKAKGLRLYCDECWARTLSRTADGRLVIVKRFPDGLCVDDWSDGPHRNDGVPSLWTSKPCL